MDISRNSNDQRVSILLDHQYLSSLTESQSNCCADDTSEVCVKEISKSKQEPDPNGLNANAIQQCFQNMLQLTALSDLDSRQKTPCTDMSECKFLRFELRFAKSDSDIEQTSCAIKLSKPVCDDNVPKQTASETSQKKDDALIKPVLPTEDDAKRQKEWKKFNREFQEEVRYNALLQHTMSLLVKRWAEYLAFTPDQMFQFELENAKDSNLTDDVIEILQDRDLHIWQIIDMINDS